MATPAATRKGLTWREDPKTKAKVISLIKAGKTLLKSNLLLTCKIDSCHYQTESHKDFSQHEKYKHFSWAYQGCQANLDMIDKELIHSGQAGGPWKCMLCGSLCHSEEYGVAHVAERHEEDFDFDDVSCVEEDCQFSARHPKALIDHFKVLQ